MENLEFSLDAVYREVLSRMETQGAFDAAAREELIDEILEEKVNDGILPDDFDAKAAHESLEYMLKEHLEESGLIVTDEEGEEKSAVPHPTDEEEDA